MSNLQKAIETHVDEHIMSSNGRFILNLCVKGANFDEHFGDGIVAGCGGLLTSEGFVQALYLGGKSRYHPPIRAKVINHGVKMAKLHGATSMLVKESGLHDTMAHVKIARQRDGCNKKGKPMQGFAELDQVLSYIEEGFLTLERPHKFEKKFTSGREIAALVVETGLQEPQVNNVLNILSEENASGVTMGEEALHFNDKGHVL